MRCHIIITGFVQGVGYRKFVKHKARELRLTGWVRNNHDGSVEAVVQGDKMHMEELVEACKKGPMLSQVDNIHVEWESDDEHGEEFGEFVVKHE